MKNKKLIYFLLPAVFLLWGYIIYTIFFSVATIEGDDTFLSIKSSKRQSIFVKDTFSLLKNYSDPFLKSERHLSSSSHKSDVTSSRPNQPRVVVEPIKIIWPQIQYGGLIKRMNENRPLAIVKINGRSEFMRSGETVEEVKLLKIFNDSIIVSYKKQDKTIIK